MIKITKLEIGTYKLYQDTELDLTQLSGLVSLQGNNLDSPTLFSSNSVGKTTLINAILHCLFGKNLTGESIERVSSAYSGKKPDVTVTLEIDGKEVIIRNNYEDNYWKVYEQGMLQQIPAKKAVAGYITELLGINHFLFSNLTYISPTSQSLFSSVSNDNQSKFIQTLLNLDFIEGVNKKSSADLKMYRGEYNLKIKELSMYQNQVESLNKQLDLVPEIKDIDFDSQINTLTVELRDLQILRDSTKKICDEENAQRELLTKKIVELNSEIRFLEKSYKEEQDLIAKGCCPTCNQTTDKLEIKTDLSKLKKLKQEVAAKLDLEISKKAEVKKFENELQDILSNATKIRANLDRLKQDKEAHIKQKSSETVRENIMQQLQDAVASLVSAQENIQELEKKVYILELISESTSARGFVKQRISLFIKLYNIELQKLSRELLGSDYSTEIIKTKNNGFELYITDSDVTLSYNALSSGFKSRLDIVLSLALAKAVELLTGISINILVLDEIISSIDATGVQAIEKMLNKIKINFPDKLIFLVSHNQNVLADNVLTIERHGDVSKFITN